MVTEQASQPEPADLTATVSVQCATAPNLSKQREARTTNVLARGLCPFFSYAVTWVCWVTGALLLLTVSTACNKRLDCVALSAFGQSPFSVLPDSLFIQAAVSLVKL